MKREHVHNFMALILLGGVLVLIVYLVLLNNRVQYLENKIAYLTANVSECCMAFDEVNYRISSARKRIDEVLSKVKIFGFGIGSISPRFIDALEDVLDELEEVQL